MYKCLIPFAFAAALAGCAETPAPAPAPEPDQLRLFLARLEAPLATRRAGRDRIAKADRMIAPLEKLPADKIDPSVAEALIAR